MTGALFTMLLLRLLIIGIVCLLAYVTFIELKASRDAQR
jgi:hypothetical protein